MLLSIRSPGNIRSNCHPWIIYIFSIADLEKKEDKLPLCVHRSPHILGDTSHHSIAVFSFFVSLVGCVEWEMIFLGGVSLTPLCPHLFHTFSFFSAQHFNYFDSFCSLHGIAAGKANRTDANSSGLFLSSPLLPSQQMNSQFERIGRLGTTQNKSSFSKFLFFFLVLI